MVKMKEQPGRKEKLSADSLLQLLPAGYIEQLAIELMADKWVRKLSAGVIFKLVLFSILSGERLSLRMMEDNYSDPLFQTMASVLAGDAVRWTGIRERLMQLKPAFCSRLYEQVYEQAHQLYGARALQGYHIRRYDSTLVATFSHLLQGMKVGNTTNGKEQVKFTTELKDDFLLHMHFHSDQAHLSEETALREAVLQATHQPTDISVFDKGVKSRQTFAELDSKGIRFVGRLCGQPRYELLHPVWEDRGLSDTEELEFVQDSAVYLYGDGGKVVPVRLRLVQFRQKQQQQQEKESEVLSFITNVWRLPAAGIAELYRSRWEIEVLFRFMKQEMNLSHLVCHDRNAIEVMLYFTLIASMLVLIYKKQNGIPGYKRAKARFFKELFYSILVDLMEQSPEAVEHLKQNLKNFIQKE